jgi:hypothetical protein
LANSVRKLLERGVCQDMNIPTNYPALIVLVKTPK